MVVHDATRMKPLKTGDYVTYTIKGLGGDKFVHVATSSYDAELDGWNIHRTIPGEVRRDYELFPDFWSELPDPESLKGGRDV